MKSWAAVAKQAPNKNVAKKAGTGTVPPRVVKQSRDQVDEAKSKKGEDEDFKGKTEEQQEPEKKSDPRAATVADFKLAMTRGGKQFPCGLENPRNVCYVNSVLCCVFSLPLDW